MSYRKFLAIVAALAVVALSLVLVGNSERTSGVAGATPATCARYYVATGDGVPFGKDADGNGSDDTNLSYAQDLLSKDLSNNPPSGSGAWCLKNLATDGTTTDTYVNGSGAQMAVQATYKPTLVTIQLGRQNATIDDLISTCLTDIKNHEFTDASTCALNILARTDVFNKLRNDLSAILSKYQTAMSGNPKMVVVVVGYYNMYPHATTAATKMVDLCPQLEDTIPTCIARWVLLPPALIALDEVTKQINSTESTVVQKFTAGMQGRFVFVNPYDAFNDQCMKMNVTIKTKVYHPTNTVHDHNSDTVNFGCDPTYIASDGNDGGTSPFIYLTPAVDGVLLTASQTTADLGVNPNDNGHQCIAKLVWHAVYQKLGWPQSPVPPSSCS